LNQLFENNAPITDVTISYGAEADNVLDCYRVIRQHINLYGADGIGSFIVSMTRTLSDLLVVYLLMRETQLLNTKIKVVPFRNHRRFTKWFRNIESILATSYHN
jgi:phosphoenolpyruvate carboxylase